MTPQCLSVSPFVICAAAGPNEPQHCDCSVSPSIDVQGVGLSALRSIVLHQSRGCTNPSPSVSDGDVSVAGLAKFVGLRDRYHQPGFCYFREVARRKPIGYRGFAHGSVALQQPL